MNGEPDVLDEVTPELVRRVETALAEDKADEVRTLLAELSPAGQASILEQLPSPSATSWSASSSATSIPRR